MACGAWGLGHSESGLSCQSPDHCEPLISALNGHVVGCEGGPDSGPPCVLHRFVEGAQPLDGASSPELVIRLRQAVVGAAAAGVFAVIGRPPIFDLASSR
jgi:hypothetical protein